MNKPIHYATSKLKQFRESKGWTQKEMADFLSLQLNEPINRTDVNRWENGVRGIEANRALEMSRATKIPVMDLVVTREEAHKDAN